VAQALQFRNSFDEQLYLWRIGVHNVNHQLLKGHWNEIRGKVRQRWGELSDDDLSRVQGNYEQLVGLIQRKTGEARNQIENFLSNVASDGSSLVNQMAETAQEYAGQAVDTVRAAASTAADAARSGIAQTRDVVKRHPLESLATCFGVGLIVGALVGLTLRSR
jgi:uncharacterized protein YjbJ (UPF0337 family)